MKLRQIPEDFIVEEKSELKINKNHGQYKLYQLEKKGIESFAIFRHLARQNKIPYSLVGFAGLKDKHAITKQFFTIPSKFNINNLSEKNFKIALLGFVDTPIKTGDLEENKFIITIRSLYKGELPSVYERAKHLFLGVPNYFDSQRFGSVIKGNFIAKFVMKKNYESAVKTFLTEYSKSENKSIKDEKRNILQNWQNIFKIHLKSSLFKSIIDEFKLTKSWLSAYKKIPREIREMFVSAYQSFLWNECVKELLRCRLEKNQMFKVEYNIGTLIFFKNTSSEQIAKFPPKFKSINENQIYDDYQRETAEKILEREKISLEEFDIKESGNFFGSFDRETIVKPRGFQISEPLIDEINDKGKKNTFKVIVEFSLQKGSYATIITKMLFGK